MIAFFYFLFAAFFIFPTIAVVFYLAGGIRMIRHGRMQSDNAMIKKGKITIVNSLASLALILFFTYAAAYIFLSWEL